MPPSSSTQYKVARICELPTGSSDNGLVFDMRDSSPASFHGSVHAIYHYIGDSLKDACDESFFSGAVRTISHDSMASERLEELLLLFGTKIVTLFGQRKNVFVKQKHSGQRSNF